MPSELTQLTNIITASPAFQVAKFSVYGLIAFSWLAMIAQVSKDSEKRIEQEGRRLASVLLPLFLWLPGWLIYLLLRPAQTLAEKRSLRFIEESFGPEEEAVCGNCGTVVAEGFLYCPQCGDGLYRPCPQCARPLREEWRFCPHCREPLA